MRPDWPGRSIFFLAFALFAKILFPYRYITMDGTDKDVAARVQIHFNR